MGSRHFSTTVRCSRTEYALARAVDSSDGIEGPSSGPIEGTSVEGTGTSVEGTSVEGTSGPSGPSGPSCPSGPWDVIEGTYAHVHTHVYFCMSFSQYIFVCIIMLSYF